MLSKFDFAASNYDNKFSFSLIGNKLRQQVWDYLDKAIDDNQQLNILELNCGTGEDACYLAEKGHIITATDESFEMINIVNEKISKRKLNGKLFTKQLGFEQIDDLFKEKNIDLVFSNFGGLNCICPDKLKKLSQDIKKVIKDDGKFVAVVMSKLCLWEIFYYSFKLNYSEAFRRRGSQPKNVRMNKSLIDTWYYSPKEFVKIFDDNFIPEIIKPVGIILPPPYSKNYFDNKISLLNFFEKIESLFSSVSFFAKYSDHFLIDFRLKQ